jgi:hypothetical protein
MALAKRVREKTTRLSPAAGRHGGGATPNHGGGDNQS